jgi:hypothetical protein
MVEAAGIEPASCGIVGAEEQGRSDERVGTAFGPAAGGPGGQTRGSEGSYNREEGLTIFREIGAGPQGKPGPSSCDGYAVRIEAVFFLR